MCEDFDIQSVEQILKDITVSKFKEQLVVSSKVKTSDGKWIELSVRVDETSPDQTFEAVATKWERSLANSTEKQTQLQKRLFSGILGRNKDILCPISPP